MNWKQKEKTSSFIISVPLHSLSLCITKKQCASLLRTNHQNNLELLSLLDTADLLL